MSWRNRGPAVRATVKVAVTLAIASCSGLVIAAMIALISLAAKSFGFWFPYAVMVSIGVIAIWCTVYSGELYHERFK